MYLWLCIWYRIHKHICQLDAIRYLYICMYIYIFLYIYVHIYIYFLFPKEGNLRKKSATRKLRKMGCVVWQIHDIGLINIFVNWMYSWPCKWYRIHKRICQLNAIRIFFIYFYLFYFSKREKKAQPENPEISASSDRYIIYDWLSYLSKGLLGEDSRVLSEFRSLCSNDACI